MAISKLGVNGISLAALYKCCDFKPLYGEIFSDYIDKYEYWGHCDFDMIFGDIYSFLQKHEYRKYDKFSNLGYLSFYRNTPEVNHYYTKAGSFRNYMDVITSDDNFAFDENYGIVSIYLHNNLSLFKGRLYADISDIYHCFRLSEFCSLVAKDRNYRNQIFYWEKGKVYRAYWMNNKMNIEEFMYIHFKKRPDFNVGIDVLNSDAFYICPTGFVVKNGDILLKTIRKLNYSSYVKDLFECMRWKGGKILKAILRRLKV